MPERVQWKRGHKLPPNTKLVTRATRWGNPFRIPQHAVDRAAAVGMFEAWVPDQPGYAAEARRHLRGHDLACSCPLDGKPCHADVLLALANGPD